MKKILLLLGIVLGFGIDAVAQKDTVVVIGQKMDGKAFSVPALHFDKSVFTFNFSGDKTHVCVSYRDHSKDGKSWKNNGKISYIDFKECRELWHKPIDYQKANAICTNNGILVHGRTTIFYSKTNGIKLWEILGTLIQVDDFHKLFIGYRGPTSNQLCAFNIADGSELWNTKVSREYGWTDQINISSSEKLVVADNLYRINLSTGEALQYPLKVGKPDVGSMFLQGLAAVAAAGIGVAAATAQSYRFYYSPVMMTNNVITGMVSNICQNDSVYYIADCDKVLCVDRFFQCKWTCDFPKNLASHSKLLVNGNRLYMLNMGYGLKNGSLPIKNGRPFLASYDIHTGKQIYMNTLSPKKYMIKGAIATKDAFFILSDSALVYQNVVDTTVSRHDWNVNKYGKLCQLITDTVYVIDSIKGNFTPIYFDGVNCPVYSDKGHLYVVDKDLKIKADYPRNSIYVPCVRMKGYFCVNKDKDFWFINKFGLPVIHFNTGIRHSEFIGNKLTLLTYKNDLLFIDIDKVVN
jgi:outer membrane protein assembly factor BamB